jgi:hypothetical protein
VPVDLHPAPDVVHGWKPNRTTGHSGQPVRAALARTAADDSVHVHCPQRGSSHRQIRFRRTGVTGRPVAWHTPQQVLPLAVWNGDHPTPRAAGHRLSGLDQQLQLAAVQPGRQHHDAG